MENNLCKIMRNNAINVSQLSCKTGISRTTITEILSNKKNNITVLKAKRIAKGLNCSVSEIFPDLAIAETND